MSSERVACRVSPSQTSQFKELGPSLAEITCIAGWKFDWQDVFDFSWKVVGKKRKKKKRKAKSIA